MGPTKARNGLLVSQHVDLAALHIMIATVSHLCSTVNVCVLLPGVVLFASVKRSTNT